MSKNLRKLAEDSLNKPSKLGPDINLDKYDLDATPHSEISSLTELTKEYQECLTNVGISAKEVERSGSFLQMDHSVVYSKTKETGVEIMDTVSALKKYPWLEKYSWQAVPVGTDKYTAQAELKQTYGYFIRALPKVKTTLPIQSCLFISQEGIGQNVHNIVIAEEGSELQIITGCSTASHINRGLHIGITEFYIEKNASLVFTMIHSWGPNVHVRPRTATYIYENGTFVSNYICLNPVNSLQMYPTSHCLGKNSKVSYSNLLYGLDSSNIDVGSKAILRGENTDAEIKARVIGADESQIISRGHLVGENKTSKGHLECRGLLTSNKARIHAVPELECIVEGSELSHEAAIGKIKQEELWYLMSRSLNESEATSMIINGFLDPDIIGLPYILRDQIKKIIEKTRERL